MLKVAVAKKKLEIDTGNNSAKNTKIVINDTDKNMGAADANKEDVIIECVRQS